MTTGERAVMECVTASGVVRFTGTVVLDSKGDRWLQDEKNGVLLNVTNCHGTLLPF